jgi:hypothetical protein
MVVKFATRLYVPIDSPTLIKLTVLQVFRYTRVGQNVAALCLTAADQPAKALKAERHHVAGVWEGDI